MDVPDEPDLFAGQEPAPPPTPECPDCRLAIDKQHTKERCEDWTRWRLEYRAKFDSMQWS